MARIYVQIAGVFSRVQGVVECLLMVGLALSEYQLSWTTDQQSILSNSSNR